MRNMPAKEMSSRERKAWEQWLETCRRIELGKAPIQDASEADKAKRIAKLLKPQNFDKFCQYYFADYCSADFGWFHKEAWEDVLIHRERNNIWEWPRESAKSVFADVFIVTHTLLTGWLDGLILASENEDKAKNLIKDVQAELMYNPRIKADFGDFGITGSWMQGFFQTKEGIGFWAFGLGQNPAGVRNGHRRPNLGIVDDADNKDVARNQKRTKERVDWVLGEFMGCLQKEQRIFIYCNNRIHKEGLTAHISGDLEEGQPLRQGYKRIKVWFTEDPVTREMLLPEQGGVPSWPERFSAETATTVITEMGWRNALRQLYHLHIEEGNVFKEEMLPWVDPLPLSKYDKLATYCDPAYGESGKNCYKVIVLVGLLGMEYHILWAWVQQRGSFAEAQRQLAADIENGNLLYYPSTAQHRERGISCKHYTEANELQKILLTKIYQEENTRYGVAWWPIFDMEKKANKNDRIEAMEPLALHGHLAFNNYLRNDRDMIELRNQFLGFPDGYVDGPDAVQGAITKLDLAQRHSGKTLYSFARKPDPARGGNTGNRGYIPPRFR